MLWKTLISITSITILLTIALLKGEDGVILASGLALIAYIGGFELGKHLKS